RRPRRPSARTSASVPVSSEAPCVRRKRGAAAKVPAADFAAGFGHNPARLVRCPVPPIGTPPGLVPPMRLLVVDDHPHLNRQLCAALADAGYAVDKAFDGEEGHYLGENEPYDAIVLDLGLPKMDGISVLESWRRGGKDTPVLILTARDRWSEKV